MYLENPSYQQRHRAQRSHPSQKYIFYFFLLRKTAVAIQKMQMKRQSNLSFLIFLKIYYRYIVEILLKFSFNSKKRLIESDAFLYVYWN